MKVFYFCPTLWLLFVCNAELALPQVPSFSGADGAGSQATGGRGGVVYHVTKLDRNYSDSGPGTLRYGVNDSNFKDLSGNVIPRTIVFDVGGSIWLGRYADQSVGWDTQDPISLGSHVTLAGQTAPGGITIMGGGLKVNGNNAIIRNVTVAPGYGGRRYNSVSGYADSYVYDGMNIHADKVIVDHVTTLYATDEGISADEFAKNVTVQYSIIAQGQNYPQLDAEGGGYKGHALGSLWQPGSNAQTSVLHNLYANEGGRVPRVGTEAAKLTVPGVGAINDFRNNVFYNWLNTAGTGAANQPSTNNFVANFYLAGPGGDVPIGGNATTAPTIGTQTGGTSIFNGDGSVTGIYHSANVKDINKDGDANDITSLTNSDFINSTIVASPYAVPYKGITESAATAFSRVLAFGGSNWSNRDSIQSTIINNVANGTGRIEALNDPTHGVSWNALLNSRSNIPSTGSTGSPVTGGIGGQMRDANYDTDSDGIPNVWEIAHGMNPNVANNNGNQLNNGYTDLENYLNEVAAFPAPGSIVFNNANATSRYAEIGNWATGVFQPSRFDEAQLNNGTARIDVPGLHAGSLKIATSAGNVATLNVTKGWINIAQTLNVGLAGNGSVNQSGGTVVAGTSVVLGGAEAGVYILSNGTLATPLLSKGNSASTFTLSGGTLHADRVAFSFSNAGGTISPGSDVDLTNIMAASLPNTFNSATGVGSFIGSTHVNGNLMIESGSLLIDIASLSSFDTLLVDDLLSLGGSLDVHLLTGYFPNPNDEFRIASAASITGAFSFITPGFQYRVSGRDLYITAIPEPCSLVLSGLGLAAAIGASSHRRRRVQRKIKGVSRRIALRPVKLDCPVREKIFCEKRFVI